MADYAIHEETLTDVADVIRKKDGTSALIDPADYAERINLMGMLEEKTASGAIATFDDGADAVPLKKCEITLPASLDGYSSVDVVACGKNLLDVSTAQGTGTIWFHYDNGIKLKKGATYTFSCGNYGSGSISFYGLDHTTQIAYAYISASSAKVTYTPAEDIIVVPRIYQSGLTVSGLVDVMLEVGSEATAYEPYEAPTTHTVDLGRTIHGGTADVVAGQGESKCGKIVFDGSESRWSAYTTGNGYAIPLSGMKRGTWYTSDSALSYPLPKVPNNDNLGVRIGVNNDGIYVVQANTIEGVTDLESFKAYLAENPLTVIYPLATPEQFTFDPVPIDSKLGNNTLWSEQGNIELTYRSQGTVYQYPEGEGVSF